MEYRHPPLYFHPHIETIAPALLRKIKGFAYTRRERIDTPDDDFLDLDFVENKNDEVVILSHGLEGNSTRPYILGMARALARENFDIIAWNYRGCSEEMNRQLRFYHSGATDDLQLVINHALIKDYKKIHLLGFSLGGNITLKYLGEQGAQLNPAIQTGVAFSVPLDLHSSCIKISTPGNFIYAKRFLRHLKEKVRIKSRMMPEQLDARPLKNIKTLIDFDDQYTAPIHGFKDAVEYYNACSSIHFLNTIKTPTLIVNAQNDPFLSNQCYPVKPLEKHRYVNLEIPKRGGHVGFTEFTSDGIYWSEKRALGFITQNFK